MAEPRTDVERQVEAAFHFRGNVTITLGDGERFEAYLFNRELGHPRLKEPSYVDVFRAGKAGTPERIAISRIATVELTGKDHASFTPAAPAEA